MAEEASASRQSVRELNVGDLAEQNVRDLSVGIDCRRWQGPSGKATPHPTFSQD
jgi:hypothetical protein